MATIVAAIWIFSSIVLCINCEKTKYAIAKKAGKVETWTLQSSTMEPLSQQEKYKDTVREIEIYCYLGEYGTLASRAKRVFLSAQLRLNISGDGYQLFEGRNESHVYDQYKDTVRSWLSTLSPWQTRSYHFYPFNQTCVGVHTLLPYQVRFITKAVDPWSLVVLLAGVVLFFSAKRLSSNILFYYGTGVSVGVLASLLVVVFILSRFIPWKKTAVGVFLGGGVLVGFTLKAVWHNLQSLILAHYQYFVGYCVVAAVISFAFCYYRGPVSDPRSLNLIKWSIQLVGLAAVAFSTQVPEVSAAFIILLLTVYSFPTRTFFSFKRYWRRKFPKARRLLTEDEYLAQGDANTWRALEDLREHCRSPDCDAWKTISRISSPQKFAKWVEGNSHLSDHELEAYDSDPQPSYEFTDDEDEIDFRLNSL